MTDLLDTFDELAKLANGAFDDIPECRHCGKMLISEGVEPPPLGPLCFGCFAREAERLQAANAELLAACDAFVRWDTDSDTPTDAHGKEGERVSRMIHTAYANANPSPIASTLASMLASSLEDGSHRRDAPGLPSIAQTERRQYVTQPILPEEIWAIAYDGNGLGDLVLTEDAECGPTPIVSTSEAATSRQIAKLSSGRRCRPALAGVHPRYREQANRLQKDRNRVTQFLQRKHWRTINRRRSELIDREVYKKDLSEAETSELKSLQLIADILVGFAHPRPDPDEMVSERLLPKLAKYKDQLAACRAYLTILSGMVPSHVASEITAFQRGLDAENEACGKSLPEPKP
jgi:hypothetical protein